MSSVGHTFLGHLSQSECTMGQYVYKGLNKVNIS